MRHQTPQRLSACSRHSRRRYSNGRQCRPLSGVATRHCRRIGFATGQRASIASITLTSSRIILSEFYPWGEVFLSSPNVYNRLTQFAGPGMAEQRDAVGSGAGATRASMRKGCGWAATPTMASRIGAPAAAGNTSQASSGYPRCDFLCLRDRIANIGRAQLRSSSVPPRRCPSRSSPPRESSCGGGSTSSEGALRLGQGAGAAAAAEVAPREPGHPDRQHDDKLFFLSRRLELGRGGSR